MERSVFKFGHVISMLLNGYPKPQRVKLVKLPEYVPVSSWDDL